MECAPAAHIGRHALFGWTVPRGFARVLGCIGSSLFLLLRACAFTLPGWPSWSSAQSIILRNLCYTETLFGQVFERIATCLSKVKAHVQAAVMCQYKDPIDYNLAAQEIEAACGIPKTFLPVNDAYLGFFWDLTMLEQLLHLHAKMGDAEKITLLVQLIGRQQFNEATDTKTRFEAIVASRHAVLRALAREFGPATSAVL
eukprot:m.213535 g.213535  ORF g.213535 m.213535 type:complete len:200 (-) comp10762_c0_seq14:525-1124(-)